ncbi:Nlpd [Buchnera aphidicola str. G002 (Myzus persicae)]|uniref:Nlpd n=2 Tax=Buchnera aphidicola TaxID=9 RepID=W0P3F4_BUCMP|nr:peptidoglycan DD-metalloendopeptidase family protein [Buchnera aphidicola]AHG59977.1 Nlpd [Buchnera aphidicola str. USDA (Myzus persicae)]AHG61130.1 Nlpd [Buchnera aphidicola str. G002 (Myzus persicae)]AHG61702.1 Nlpd [Buchnera aphidicola str. F009 (Myzus persicae)]WAI03341.1 MAG: peptidoglycan DD-metalloendopeptidase family protein [Buchnera aphidicola (Myzus persicae)]AHG60557.1 Nlpd [Buchnera aphidicola str. W106 (Myzus persicae)]
MLLKCFLYKLFFLIFMSLIYNNFVFASSIENNSFIYFDHNSKKKIFFFNKNECFSFFKSKKNISLKKHEITVFNHSFIGLFRENKFQMFYTVKRNDNLYSIAKKSGHNYYELSKFNYIKKPYKIIVGQKIWIGDFLINQNNCSIIDLNKKNSTSCELIFNNPLKLKNFLKDTSRYSTSQICFFCDETTKKKSVLFRKKNFISSKDWDWPIKSTNIKYIYHSKSKNKEIEFFGFKGQPVFAAATGKVVCVTDIFKKYGRLIILKHSQNYLSIYAFNNLILVKQQDTVHVNQQISTMGSSENNSSKLYFEIRYRGQSINPLNILPQINTKRVIY